MPEPTTRRDGCEIVILGAGGTGMDAVEILEALNAAGKGKAYECVGILDDAELRWGGELSGVRILGPLAMAREMSTARFVHAIGSPRNYRERLGIAESLGLQADRFETLVHPSAVVSPRCRLGHGVIVCPNAFLGPQSEIGDGVTILANATVNHDTEVGDWSLVASGANLAGGVRCGAGSYIGAGAAVKEGIRIGGGSLVGIGAVVIEDVPAMAVVVGNPARLMPRQVDPT
jgi:sugar O-acyltransferase (sialic acid O-acetyltransferase NeuD family)